MRAPSQAGTLLNAFRQWRRDRPQAVAARYPITRWGALTRADPHRLGIDGNAQAEVLDVNGRPNARLLALGPMTRQTFRELVAVPELRRRNCIIARRLSNAQRVEGGGALSIAAGSSLERPETPNRLVSTSRQPASRSSVRGVARFTIIAPNGAACTPLNSNLIVAV
ncbi:hypothetical protein [Sphingomonas sp. TZW2008]|uniref:hypothetical protein n=1 Tax=Sphingomonas sp. TZW2008 TaxID=1917973 RepID=UPI001181AD2E|nr:hypothetical protein [Sphingomonas sp. TZW2008]